MNDFSFEIADRGLQYIGAARLEGPLVVVERVRDVGFDEMVEILDPAGHPRIGRVLDISETHAVVQVLEGTSGLANQTLRARFLGESFRQQPDEFLEAQRRLGERVRHAGRSQQGISP